MKTYAEKLKDPRWLKFRRDVLAHYGNECRCCGQYADSGTLHIHHKRYIKAADPWDYPMDDVSVYCRDCHTEIHDCENAWRDLVRRTPSWAIRNLVALLQEIDQADEHNLNIVIGRAKSAARQTRHETANHEAIY